MNGLCPLSFKGDVQAINARQLLPNSMEPENGNQMRRTNGPGGLEEGISFTVIRNLGAVSSRAGICVICEIPGSAVI